MDNPKSYINNAVVISDLHAGCQLALCPPEVRLDGGGTYHASKAQLVLWDWWGEFWDWVKKATRREAYCVILNGDAMDGRHHGTTTQITQNLADQINIARMILEPIVKKCKGQFYMIRGTEAHVGQTGENEEKLAQLLGAKQDKAGNYSWNELWLSLGGEKGSGTLCHFLHHIGVTGSQAYEGTALNKELTEHLTDAARWRNLPPDIIIRSHRHRHFKCEIATANNIAIAEVTPGWQLKTPFSYRIPGGRTTTPQCGGILIRHGDEEHYTRHKVFNVSRTPEEVAIETPTVEG